MNKPSKYGLFLSLGIFLVIFSIFSIFRLMKIDLSYPIIILGSFLSSLIVTIFIIYSTPVIKDIIATYRTMMRLESLSHPLLLELSFEAPGTYNHSLIVANLASRAAKSVGANSIMARIGGYYHDIGKLKHPSLYIENQVAGENPHSEINNPQKSAEAIKNHVKEGVELAEKNNLPKEIIDLIEQHHGTTTVSFFYEQAKNKDFRTKKDFYKYPGPKPLTAEAVILMLADAIEARIRLCPKVTPLEIREIVDDVINTRYKERQFDLTGLDEKKIDTIRKSFIETLATMYHQRIKYPDKNEKNKS